MTAPRLADSASGPHSPERTFPHNWIEHHHHHHHVPASNNLTYPAFFRPPEHIQSSAYRTNSIVLPSALSSMSSPVDLSKLALSPTYTHTTSSSSSDSTHSNTKPHPFVPYAIRTNEELTCVLPGLTSTPPRARGATRTPLTATHEVRLLRSQVAEMEEQLRLLNEKWATQLLDQHTLALAQHSAREKHKAMQSETTHRALQQMLLEQQLVFATLQSAMSRAPLHSSGQTIFEALHFDTRLSCDPHEREQVLLAHHHRSVATLPSIVASITQMAVNKVTATQKEKQADEVLPLSQIDVTGGRDHTLISSIFITEIPHSSLEEVYAAVLAYFDGIPSSMKRHFNVNAQRVRLNSVDSPVVYRRSTFLGAGLPATVNNIVCSELTATHGMVHIDAIVDDPLYPVHEGLSSHYGIGALSVTPHKDAAAGQTTSVTLRWVVVYNYNMLPDDEALKSDLENIRPILNGDLLTAAVCDYIQQHQQQQQQL